MTRSSVGAALCCLSHQRTRRDAPSPSTTPLQATGTAGRLLEGQALPLPRTCGRARIPAPIRPRASRPPCPSGDAPPSPWPAQGVVDGLGRLYGYGGARRRQRAAPTEERVISGLTEH